MSDRDTEIEKLLVAMGDKPLEAHGKLLKIDEDKRGAFLKKARERKRIIDDKFDREQRQERLRQGAIEGRANLREAREEARSEEYAKNRDRNPLERLGGAIQAMLIAEVGPTSAQSFANTKTSSGKAEGKAPPGAGQGFELVGEEWIELLRRLADLAEHELEILRGAATVYGGRSSDERDRRILSHVGRPIAFIAYVEQVSERHIQQLCRRERDRGRNFRVRRGRLVREETELGEVA